MIIGIIEDDHLLGQSLELMLQREGYKTVCVHSQREAETQLHGTEDLLLVDIGLPDWHGISQGMVQQSKEEDPGNFSDCQR